jgi:flagellum-specific ATP synthase
LIAAHEDVEDLLSVGAYKEGSKPVADRAIAQWERINTLLRQDRQELVDFHSAMALMEDIVHG